MKACTQCGLRKSLKSFWYNQKKDRYLAECRDCQAERRKAWKVANKDRVKERNALWQKANPDKTRATQERYRTRHPGLAAKRTAEWRKTNRVRALAAQRLSNRKLKDAVYKKYGGYKCACCGETEEAFLSIDHVNNDGALQRRQVDRRKIYKWIVSNGFPSGYQILCMNCNFGKARNGGICPHKTSEGSTTSRKA